MANSKENTFRENREYFNMYDVKDVIKTNIDYSLSNKFYFRDLDKYIMDGEIVTLNKKLNNTKDYKVLESIILDMIGDHDE